MSGGATTTYRYDAGWNVLNRYGAGGTQTYVHGPGGGILADASGVDLSTGTYRYYTQDHLGSTRGLYDSNKSGIGAYEYTPYGEEYAHTGQAARALYTGHLWDNVSQLYWAPYRFYAPAFARWITRDPAGMVDGPNAYSYVLGNPISYADLVGLWRIHGKYCGPNWTAGQKKAAAKCTDKDYETPSDDSLDECCKTHDRAYDRCTEEFSPGPKRRKCFREADRNLSKCARGIGGRPSKWEHPPKGGGFGAGSKRCAIGCEMWVQGHIPPLVPVFD